MRATSRVQAMNPLLLLKMLSPRAWMALGAAITLALLLGYASHLIGAHNARIRAEGRAEVQTLWDQAEKARALVAAKAQADARTEETRRTQAQMEIANESQRMATRRAAAADTLDAAAPGLRNAVAAAISSNSCRATEDSAAHPASPTARAPGVVLADVLGSAETRLRQLAEGLDASRAAGNACAAAYDALSPQ